MFARNYKLEKLETGNDFIISGIIDLSWIFSNCHKIDIKFVDTSTTTNMSYLFNSYPKLISIDLSNFNTSKVTKWVICFQIVLY